MDHKGKDIGQCFKRQPKCIREFARVRYSVMGSESLEVLEIVPPPMSVMRRWRAFCGRGLDWVHARLGPVLRQSRRLARKIFNQRAVQAPACTFTACSPLIWSLVTLLGSFCAQDQCSSTVQLHDPKNDPFVFVDSLLCSLVTFSIRSITWCKMVQNLPWNHLEMSLMLINSHSFHGGSKLVGGKVELFEASTDVGRKGSLEKNPYSKWEERPIRLKRESGNEIILNLVSIEDKRKSEVSIRGALMNTT